MKKKSRNHFRNCGYPKTIEVKKFSLFLYMMKNFRTNFGFYHLPSIRVSNLKITHKMDFP